MFPKSIPFLRARQFCRLSLNDEKERHCLLGWCNSLFLTSSSSFKERNEAIRSINSVIAQESHSCTSVSTVFFNDNPSNPKSKLADVFNAAMRKLGYRKRGNRMVLTRKGGVR